MKTPAGSMLGSMLFQEEWCLKGPTLCTTDEARSMQAHDRHQRSVSSVRLMVLTMVIRYSYTFFVSNLFS
jgi:hypothetical protein